MHFRSTGTLAWNAVETTYKNDVIMYLMCSVNYEIKNIYGFHLTHPRMYVYMYVHAHMDTHCILVNNFKHKK